METGKYCNKEKIDKTDDLIDYLLYNPMKKWGKNHVINIYNNKFYTYNDYETATKKMASYLNQLGVRHEAVIILMDDCPECIVAFLSSVYIKAKPLIISPKTKDEVMEQIIKISRSRILIKSKDICLHINTDGICIINVSYCDEIKFITESIAKVCDNVPEIEDDVCYLALTSGSSGIPKVVKHGVQEMQSATYYYANKTLHIDAQDTLFSIPKINYTYGLANNLFFSFASGARAILYHDTLGSREIVSLISKYNVTCFFAVPSVYAKLMNETESEKLTFMSVRLFVSAGDYLPGDINQNWQKRTGRYIADSVGCSETGSAYLVNFGSLDKSGSAGTAVPGYQLEFYGGDAVQGMLVVSGPSNAIGYLNDKDNTEKKFIDGKIYTGDWFRKDSDGYYWFLGRADDMIKKNGRWVSLNEVSEFVKGKRGILNAVCFKNMNEIYAVLEVSDEFEGIGRLRDYIRDSLEHYKCPDIIILGDIPFNSNGKVDYQMLRGRYGKTVQQGSEVSCIENREIPRTWI